MIFPDLPGFIWFLFTTVSAGFIWLLWRLLKEMTDGVNKLREEITKLKDELVKTRENFAEKFRTKEEAGKDWANLKETLADLKALNYRVTQLETQR